MQVCYICEKNFSEKLFKDINYRKVRDHYHYTGKYWGPANSICYLKFNMPNEIPIIFHNRSKNDYYFIIKMLANEFEGPFGCIWENSEAYKSFFVPIKKEVIKLMNMVMKVLKLYSGK